ncbi:GIN domain-containing protein [Sphingobium aquiterrae]|uniref:GIN domain-containing protein n=1 Tax=Sphingobium aquiterrae TaxID=2038656 RepID=UPI0030164149
MTHVRHLLPAIIATGIAALPCAPFCALAHAATQPYVVTTFDSIRVEAPVRVAIRTGAGTSARGEGDRQILDRLEVLVSGGLLLVRLRPPASLGEARPGGTATLTLSTGLIRRAQLLGGGALTIDAMKGQRGDIALAGSGDIAVGAVALDRLVVMVAGNGRMTLSGAAGVLEARSTGAGIVDAPGLKAKQATLVNQGPGSITLTVNGPADIATAGSGDVTVLGTPACKVTRGGTGRISCGGKDY